MNKDRLQTLAAFLRRLPEEKFDFTLFVARWDRERNCGSVCCALGWLPAVFPAHLAWDRNAGGVDFIERSGGHTFVVAANFFGLGIADIEYLFSPHGASGCDEYDDENGTYGPRLPGTATADDVADHIKRFIKIKRRAKTKTRTA